MSVNTSVPPRRVNFATRAAILAAKFSTGKGGGSGWYKYFRPSKLVPNKVRFFEGKYLSPVDGVEDPHYNFVEHKLKLSDKQFFNIPCTQRPGDHAPAAPFPCVACHYKEAGDARITSSEKWVFNLLWLTNFHEVEEPSKRDASKTVKYKEACPGRGCERCAHGEPKTFGDRRWFSVGRNHFTNIATANKQIGQSCRCGGELTRVSFECLNCAEMLLDIANSKKTVEQEEQYAGQMVTCRKCRQTSIPAEVLECSKCQDPVRLQIFDTDIEIQKSGEGTGTILTFPKWTQKATPIPEALKAMAEPWDFDVIFKADEPAVMAKRLKLANPFLGLAKQRPAGAEAATVDYEGGPATDESVAPEEN